MPPLLILPHVVLSAALALAPDTTEVRQRLRGHAYRVQGGSIVIDSVAGEGKPLVGCVVRDGDRLLLQSGDEPTVQLRGELAVMRIAGPGYLVWVLGPRDGDSLTIRRIGVLVPASDNPCASPGR
jgi:hypothetical protein